ncbi:hypothetical protein SLA2020_505660 [Shorea laevis]
MSHREEDEEDGDKMENGSIGAAFVTAANSMKSTEKWWGKKQGTERKEKNRNFAQQRTKSHQILTVKQRSNRFFLGKDR